ncbi:hypothetical protein SDJN02_10989, partial [Cucurbita argyrosperma subsp. argyrosperma]
MIPKDYEDESGDHEPERSVKSWEEVISLLEWAVSWPTHVDPTFHIWSFHQMNSRHVADMVTADKPTLSEPDIAPAADTTDGKASPSLVDSPSFSFRIARGGLRSQLALAAPVLVRKDKEDVVLLQFLRQVFFSDQDGYRSHFLVLLRALASRDAYRRVEHFRLSYQAQQLQLQAIFLVDHQEPAPGALGAVVRSEESPDGGGRVNSISLNSRVSANVSKLQAIVSKQYSRILITPYLERRRAMIS